MSPLDREVLAERVLSMRRHLSRVAERLPAEAADFASSPDAVDSVVLHLWQATQIAIDLAVAACVSLGAGTPQTYADAFRRLEAHGIIDSRLADRLVRAAGFRNLVAHAYETVDLARVHTAATSGPEDLVAFVTLLSATLADRA